MPSGDTAPSHSSWSPWLHAHEPLCRSEVLIGAVWPLRALDKASGLAQLSQWEWNGTWWIEAREGAQRGLLCRLLVTA